MHMNKKLLPLLVLALCQAGYASANIDLIAMGSLDGSSAVSLAELSGLTDLLANGIAGNDLGSNAPACVIAAVPEPCALMLTGLGQLEFLVRNRKSAFNNNTFAA